VAGGLAVLAVILAAGASAWNASLASTATNPFVWASALSVPLLAIGGASVGAVLARWTFAARTRPVRRPRPTPAMAPEPTVSEPPAEPAPPPAPDPVDDPAATVRAAFYTAVSHELLTPLNAVVGYTELADEDLQGGEVAAAREDLAHVLGSARRLQALLLEVVELGRVEAGREEAFLEWFPLSAVLHDVLDHAQSRDSGHRMSCTPASSPLQVRLDRAQVHGILARLVSAAQASAPHCVIQVSMEVVTEAAAVVISVQDDGPAIDRNHLPRVFETFADVGSSVPRLQGSASVSLSLARRYAELMGGHLTVASNDHDGVTFELTLPIDASQGLREPSETDSVEAPRVPPDRSTLVPDLDLEPGPSASLPSFPRAAQLRRRRRRTIAHRPKATLVPKLSMPPSVDPIEPVGSASGRGNVLLVAPSGRARSATVDRLVGEGLCVTPCDNVRAALHIAADWAPDALVVDPIHGVPDLYELRRLARAERLADVPMLLHYGPPGVSLTLPVADLIGSPVDRSELCQALGRLRPGGGGKLLLLDDDPTSVVAAVARRQGWIVVSDENAPLQDNDVVVVDLYSPHFLALDQLLERMNTATLGRPRVVLMVPKAHRVGDEARLKVWLSSDARPRSSGGLDLPQSVREVLARAATAAPCPEARQA